MLLLLWKKAKPFRIWAQGSSAKLIDICTRLCYFCICRAVLTKVCHLEVKNKGETQSLGGVWDAFSLVSVTCVNCISNWRLKCIV